MFLRNAILETYGANYEEEYISLLDGLLERNEAYVKHLWNICSNNVTTFFTGLFAVAACRRL
jgi:hypothetical protein